VRRAGQHIDVGAGAEDAILGATDDDGAHLGVLEAEPLDGIGELDVDAEVVGVELEHVPRPQRPILLHVEDERRHRALDGELPVPWQLRWVFEADRVHVPRGLDA
jgi:hypothetical protein